MGKKKEAATGEETETTAAPPPVEVPVSETTTAADIGARMADEMPEAQPNAIAQTADKNAPEPVTVSAPQSVTAPGPTRGRGRPPLSTEEKEKRAAARKSKIGTLPKNAAPENVANAPQDQTAAISMAAGTATTLTILAACAIGGDDFAPQKNDLAGGMTDDKFLMSAYFDYFKAKGVSDIPPGVALCAALMLYIAPRLSKPQAQSRLKKVGGVVARGVVTIWRKIRRKKNNAPYADSRNDGERENYARPQAVA